jgi:hypothetical protein
MPTNGSAKLISFASATILTIAATSADRAFGDTLPWALVHAYQNNPQINSQRASVRSF